MPNITAIRTERNGGRHDHITEVLVGDEAYSLADVIAGIERGEEWRTEGPDGSTAVVRKVSQCPQGNCRHAPYLTTAPHHNAANNIVNLPVR